MNQATDRKELKKDKNGNKIQLIADIEMKKKKKTIEKSRIT